MHYRCCFGSPAMAHITDHASHPPPHATSTSAVDGDALPPRNGLTVLGDFVSDAVDSLVGSRLAAWQLIQVCCRQRGAPGVMWCNALPESRSS